MGNVDLIPETTGDRVRARGGRVASPVTMLMLGAMAATAAGRSLRRWSGARRSAGPAVDQRALDEISARLRLVTAQLEESRAGLAAAQAEVLRTSDTAKATADRAETEMGRMESAAIGALESAAAANREEVAELRRRLTHSDDAARALQTELDIERRRSEQLQSALAGRDAELSQLRASARDRGGNRHT
jgi:chromosome segregation ATPase